MPCPRILKTETVIAEGAGDIAKCRQRWPPAAVVFGDW